MGTALKKNRPAAATSTARIREVVPSQIVEDSPPTMPQITETMPPIELNEMQMLSYHNIFREFAQSAVAGSFMRGSLKTIADWEAMLTSVDIGAKLYVTKYRQF